MNEFDNVHLVGLKPEQDLYQKIFTLLEMGYNLSDFPEFFKDHGVGHLNELDFSETT